jgi:two-component system, NarL family, nitrate/nitrite response regulator NarL
MSTIEKRNISPIRILLVDDHEIFLAGLRLLLRAEPGLAVIGEAHTMCEALLAARSQPDIILLDLGLGSESSVDLLPELLAVSVKARVLVLTGVPDPDIHLRAICKGAMGVVSKLEPSTVLLKAIRKVHAGEVWVNRSMMASAIAQIHTRRNSKPEPNSARISTLTARELEVIGFVGEGRRNKQIGERMFISEKTVRHYLTSIFSKLEVGDRLELIIFAYQYGLAKLPARSDPSRIASFVHWEQP